jgi:RNAse (barnase) inhibitor barstar
MKLFVDSNRKPSNIYRNYKEWVLVESTVELNKMVNESLRTKNKFPDYISFDYDLDGKESGGLNALKDIVNTAIKLRLELPRVYLHCDDRNLAIYFENALDLYTKKTDTPYYFEFIKRD